MLIAIKGEPKYVLDSETGQLVNKASGNAIPSDEPVIIFRAQDALLPDVLAAYITHLGMSQKMADREHRLAVSLRLAEVLEWQAHNPLRVKTPDTVLDESWPRVNRT